MKRKIIPYNPKLKELAKKLRQHMTFSEVKLWNELKNGKMMGYDFDRQRPIGNYIVDFYCPKLKLVIEIDGTSHDTKKEYDENRDKILESYGLKVLHYNDIRVLSNFHLIEMDFKEQIQHREQELKLK